MLCKGIEPTLFAIIIKDFFKILKCIFCDSAGFRCRQDQPHADPLPAVRGHHRADPPADRRRLAPQGAGRRAVVRVRWHPVAGVRDPGGALRLVPLPLDQGAGCQRQGSGGGQVALSWR